MKFGFVSSSTGMVHRMRTKDRTYCGRKLPAGESAGTRPRRSLRCPKCAELRLTELRAELRDSWLTGNHEGRPARLHEISAIVNRQEDT